MAAAHFNREALAPIPDGLASVVQAGDLSGFVTLVWRRGEVVQLNTIGKRDIEADLPMQEDTLFRIASMTKPMTSIVALQLMEEGKLSLDDPIARWAPEFSSMRVLKDAVGALDSTAPAQRAITFEDLLTHRSGLAYGFTSVGPIAEAYVRELGHPLLLPQTPDEWIKNLAGLPLSYQPGERFHYSHATDLLGFLLGRIEGKPFRDVLMERVIEPLQMRDTDFWVPPEKRSRAAQLYKVDDDGKLARSSWASFEAAEPPAFCAGGGGLISTAHDYLRFARALMNKGALDGVKLVAPETFELMRTNKLSPEQRAIPFFGVPFWMGMGFGLGLSVITDPDKHEWMGAGRKGAFGWPGAFGTWWQADPEEDLILLYLVQNEMNLGPGSAAQLATGQRMGGRLALPLFQKAVYGALT